MKTCSLCKTNRPILKRPKTLQLVCKTCFFAIFEEEIHNTIVSNALFKRGDKIAIAASGGKGKLLNSYKRFNCPGTCHDYIK